MISRNYRFEKRKTEKRRAERRWRKTGLMADKLIFKSLISKLNCLINKAKKSFYQAKITATNSSKFLFGLVSNFYDKKKSTVLPNNICFRYMPDIFIEFFTSKITKIRENFSSDTMQSFSDKPFCGNSLSNFNLLSSNEVRSLIMSSPVKSCSLDPLPAYYLFKILIIY